MSGSMSTVSGSEGSFVSGVVSVKELSFDSWAEWKFLRHSFTSESAAAFPTEKWLLDAVWAFTQVSRISKKKGTSSLAFVA